MTLQTPRPATWGASRGPSDERRENGPSQVRLKIVGNKVYLPDGVTQCGVSGGFYLRGTNFAIWNGDIATDAATAKSRGITFVRKLVRADGVYGDPTADSWVPSAYGFHNPANIEQFFRETKAFTDQKIWVRAGQDSNCAVNGGIQGNDFTNVDYCTLRYGGRTNWLNGVNATYGHNVYTDATYCGQYIDSYVAMVRRLCPLPYIHSWELAPEPMINGSSGGPNLTWDSSWAPVLLAFLRKLIAAIRVVDPYTPFTVGPRSDYKLSLVAEVLMSERSDVFYTADDLSFQASKRDTHQAAVAPLWQLRDASNVPPSMQSVGVQTADEVDWDGTNSANNYALKAALSLYNAMGIDWNVWSQHQNGTGRGGYSLDISDGAGGYTVKPQMAIVTYYCGQTLSALETAAQASATATNTSNNAFLFYPKQDFSNVWKDSLKATPCSAIGDVVGYIAPVVGNDATLHFTQTTGVTQPVLATVPGPIDKQLAIQFDGANTFLSGSTTLLATGDDFTIIAACFAATAGANKQTPFAVGTSTATENYPWVQINTSNFAVATVHDDSTGSATCTGTFFPAGGNACVVRLKRVGTTFTLYVNGVQEAQVTATVGTVAPTRMRIGCNTQTQAFLNGPMAGWYICKGTCTDAQAQDIERYLGYRVGAGIGV